MSTVEEKVAKRMGRYATQLSKQMIMILKALAEFLEKNSELNPHKKLAAWIKAGNGTCMFSAPNDCRALLEKRMNEENIGYFTVNDGKGNSNFLIRNCDVEKVTELRKEICITMGNYYQQVSCNLLENAIANSKAKDKDIIEFNNLDKYEAYVLKNKCNQIAKGFTVGVDENKVTGEYKVSAHAPKTYSSDITKTDMCYAYLQTAFSLYGPNSEIKKEQIQADINFDNEIYKLNKKIEKQANNEADYGIGTTYIASTKNTRCYLELNEHGFEFYEKMAKKNSEGKDVYIDHLAFKAARADDDFDLLLEKYMDKMNDKKIFTASEFNAHMSTEEQNFESYRPQRTSEQNFLNMKESLFANVLNIAVKNSINEKIAGKSNENKFKIYSQTTAEVLDGLINDEKPKCMSESAFEDLKETVKKINVDCYEYKYAKDAIANVSMEVHQANRAGKREIRKTENKKLYNTDSKEK